MGRILTSPGEGGGISSSDVTAKSADVLAGTKTIMADSNDEVVEGEMINHGAISKVLKCGESITISQGYHNGSGEISADSLASQTEGTATASDLYTGKTMVVNGQKITGTMKDLSKSTSIQYTSDDSTKVIAGDAVFKQKNTDNVDRICIRYNGENGFITGNTLFGIPSSNFGTVSTGNVLKDQTFTSSNGLKISGTMPNNSTTTSNGTVPGISESYPNVPTREADNLQYNVGTDSIARISMEPPKGYYSGGGGSYINRPASDFGNATANRVVAGNTFTSSAGIKVSGTIVDRGLYQYGGMGEGTDYYAINALPEGWYHSDGNSWAPEARISKTTLRNYLGINAANIRSNTNIAGVAGTLSVQSAISFSAAATSYNTIRIFWKNPAKGPWQGVFIQMSTSGNPGTGGGSRVYTGKGNSSSANASNYVDITGLNANTTYYFTCTSYVDNLGWGTSYNVNAKTKAMTASDILGGYIVPSSTYISFDSPSGDYFYNGDRKITSFSGDDMYTDGYRSYTTSKHSDPHGYVEFSLSLDTSTCDKLVSQLNSSYNCLKVYIRTDPSKDWRVTYSWGNSDMYAKIQFYNSIYNNKGHLYMKILTIKTANEEPNANSCIFSSYGGGYYWMHFFKE